MPRLFLRIVALAIVLAVLSWALTRDRSREQPVTRLELPATTWEALFEVRRGTADGPATGVLDRDLAVVFEDGSGGEVLRGTLQFTSQGFRRRWSGSAEPELRLPPSAGCLVTGEVPGSARRLRLMAEGFAERAFEVDPGAPNGGLPAQVVLVP